MKRIFIVLAIFFTTSNFGYAQWTVSALPIPNNVVIYDIDFSTSGEGWAVGTHGYILHFDGEDWEVFDIIEDNNFTRVAFNDVNDGWAISTQGKIYHYDGTEWILHFSSSGGKSLFALHFISSTKAYAAGKDGYLAYYDGTYWVEGNIGFDISAQNAYFSDNKNGWISGPTNEMYQMKDSVWSKVTIPGLPFFAEMKFLSPDNGYGVGFDKDIWHYDGVEWSPTYTSNINIFTDIYFYDENHGWASGQGEVATYNNGIWTESTVGMEYVFSFYFTDLNNGWAMGENGQLLTFSSFPKLHFDWYRINEIPDNVIVSRIDKNPEGELLVVGYTESPDDPKCFLYTSDDGLTWNQIPGSLDNLWSVSSLLIKNDVLIVSGIEKETWESVILRSTDEGQTWQKATRDSNEHAVIADLTKDQNGDLYAVANESNNITVIYKSVDDGINWFQLNTAGIPASGDALLVSLASHDGNVYTYFYDKENDGTGLYKSEDGLSWTKLNDFPENIIPLDLHFMEDGNWYAIGLDNANSNQGIAYLSEDEGETWKLITTEDLDDYQGVFYSIFEFNSTLIISSRHNMNNNEHAVFTTQQRQNQIINFSAFAEHTYGNEKVDPLAFSSSGLPITYTSSNNQLVEIVDGLINLKGVGTANITAHQNGNSSYAPAEPITQELTIKKANLNVSVENIYIEPNTPIPTIQLIYSGWVNEDGIENIDVQPSVNTTATTNSPPGSYAIDISGGYDDHYVFIYNPGILSINSVTGLNSGPPTINAYPNPVNNKLTIALSNTVGMKTVKVYNIDGVEIFNQIIEDEYIELPTSKFPSGLLFIEIESDTKISKFKLMKN